MECENCECTHTHAWYRVGIDNHGRWYVWEVPHIREPDKPHYCADCAEGYRPRSSLRIKITG